MAVSKAEMMAVSKAASRAETMAVKMVNKTVALMVARREWQKVV